MTDNAEVSLLDRLLKEREDRVRDEMSRHGIDEYCNGCRETRGRIEAGLARLQKILRKREFPETATFVGWIVKHLRNLESDRLKKSMIEELVLLATLARLPRTETATCTPSHPEDSQSHPPDSEVPCRPQPEHASPSGSQSAPEQMPADFRLES